jgi:hypothetical protein
MSAPGALATDRQGNVFVAANGLVRKLAPEGSQIATIDVRPPATMAAGPNGELYASFLSEPYRVVKFDARGQRVANIGSRGSGRGQFLLSGAYALAVTTDGRLWVGESFRALQFEPSGKFILACGAPRPSNASPLRPYDLGTSGDGSLYASELNDVKRLGPTSSPGLACDIPHITRLALRPHRFRVAASPAARRRGASLSMTLSEPAAITLTLERIRRGRATGAGTLNFAGVAGANAFRLGGWVAGKRLRPGDYRLKLVARDMFANPSVARTLRFTVVD